MISILPPLPVAGPLAIAGLLLALSTLLPRRMPDVIALATTIAAAVVCVIMAMNTAQHPLVYWFGGWVPNAGHVLGIGFVVDQVGASMAAFIAVLFATTLVFAWGYFDDVHAHFHVLMLLFMAGMVGFCLTHDLFNLFVWFEVMSVAAFALTGYALRNSALEGALAFTVINTIGSYLILGGIGLIYSEVGALDFSALAKGVAVAPENPVIMTSFALLASGLLIKGAQVPFQFWLADAHAVAPSPVSVIFSGAMVSIGIYGVAKLVWTVFAPSPEIHAIIHRLLLGMGVASAVIGGVMALIQRHIKRLLAFSTISHVGILVIGLALLSRDGLGGMFVYMVGHGLVKGALFMIAGILLATCGGIDEIGLRGLGRGIWPVGVAMALGGLLLAGLPIGLLDEGSKRIAGAAREAGQGWLIVAIVIGSAFTGGAVLRVTGRVFLGLGPVPGEEDRAPTEDEQEKADRPLWLMTAPMILLMLLSLLGEHAAGDFASRAAAAFMQPDNAAILAHRSAQAVQMPPRSPGDLVLWVPWLSVALAVLIAAFGLSRRRVPRNLVTGVTHGLAPVLDTLQAIHSGLIGDYVAWLTVGLALFAVVFAVS
jgi:multicomponent Na+:H+ antiporter subunit D